MARHPISASIEIKIEATYIQREREREEIQLSLENLTVVLPPLIRRNPLQRRRLPVETHKDKMRTHRKWRTNERTEKPRNARRNKEPVSEKPSFSIHPHSI